MKYIVIDDGMIECPIIFPNHINHASVAMCMVGTVLSAGFIRFTVSGLECFGKSVSLKVKSRPEDTELVNKMIGANDG